MRRFARTVLLAILAAVGALSVGGAASASAAPVWNLDIHHHETHFPPGGTAEYWFTVNNVGSDPSSGPITLTVNLPSGLTRNEVYSTTNDGGPVANWDCPGSAGDSTVVCTTTDTIPRHTLSRSLILVVDVAPTASGERLTTATVSGGGAGAAPSAAGCGAGPAACAVERTRISPDPAPFGIVAESWDADFYERDGVTPVRQAGSHPDLATFAFDFNSITPNPASNVRQKAAVEPIRNLRVDLPPGFVGAPTAVGECPVAAFTLGRCPPSSYVGRFEVSTDGITQHRISYFSTAVYNVPHSRGSAANLSFAISGNPIHIKTRLDPSNQYAISTFVSDINETLPVFQQKLTVWGVPGHTMHDFQRCQADLLAGGTAEACSTNEPPKPFLTLPSRCGGGNEARLHSYDSWDDPGDFGPDLVHEMPGEFVDCEKQRFSPSVDVNPTGRAANSPTGLDVSIRVPQNDNPSALATPPVKSTVVTLPDGTTLNPAFADGLDGCTMQQFGISSSGVPNGEPVRCPDNSRIGEVSLTTPVLPQPVLGSMYLAKPLDNPFDTNFALYMAVRDTEERGILLKIPGRLDLHPRTGQITATFDDLPQFPFDDFTLSFRSGQRAPLVTPPTCGTQTIGIKVSSYAQPDDPVDASSSFAINEGPGGGPCPKSASDRPFEPQMAAGALSPVAGAFSSFIAKLTRSDEDQEFASLEVSPPAGVAAKLAGVTRCSEAAIASIATGIGTAQNEIDNPSCPSNSLIGTVSNGVGSGTSPNYFNGKVYLAGPYKGAPISGVAVVPGIAGPYDLGNVVVRAPAYFDPRTAEVTIKTDEIPKIVHGVLLRVRDVRINLNRPDFTVNPTDCQPKTIDALVRGAGADLFSSSDDTEASLSNRFQVGECGSLGFQPRFAMQVLNRGPRSVARSFNPAMRFIAAPRPGDANMGPAQVTLPSQIILDQSNIRTICTRAQFASETCPERSIYGYARAWSPLLDEPLEGPVYLASSTNPLPDIIADLRGEVRVILQGQIDSTKGRLRNTFRQVPDAPVSRFELTMFGGANRGVLVNSKHLCLNRERGVTNFNGQNGKRHRTRPAVQLGYKGCKKFRRAFAKKRLARKKAARRVAKRKAMRQGSGRQIARRIAIRRAARS